MADFTVSKFGGSSLADAKRMIKVKAIVESDDRRKIVVVSAPGKRDSKDIKVTDLLLRAINSTCKKEYSEAFQLVRERFLEITDELDLGLSISISAEINQIIQQLRKIPEKYKLQYAISRGEYLNAKIMAKLLGYKFIDAAKIIKFNKKGTLKKSRTYFLIKKYIANGNYVIPGFYGTDEKENITTFSRGGSDISAALIAGALNASLYENWTDVDGFLAADPKFVSESHVVRSMTYLELRELAYSGALVMHHEAIKPVSDAEIPTCIRNTFNPDDPGTMIGVNALAGQKNAVTAIASRSGFSIIQFYKLSMNEEVGVLEGVLRVFREHDISIEHAPSGIDQFEIIVKTSDLAKIKTDFSRLIYSKYLPIQIEYEHNIALVAVVGRSMKGKAGIVGRIFMALGEAEVNISLITQMTSQSNIIIGVKESDQQKAMQAIYSQFTCREGL